MLSKSNLQSYLQRSRKLWLEYHNPELAGGDDSSTRRRKIHGNLVGSRARTQLGEHFIWPPGQDNQTLAAEEAKLLLRESPHMSAAEVPMVHGGLYARADALVRDKDGYILRETKASSFPLKADKATPDKPEDHHLDDIAIQAWVMSQSGLPMTRSELNLLNSRWRYPGNGDYAGLFRQMDVTNEIATRFAEVPSWIEAAEQVLNGSMPELQTGKHCTNPYECQFQEHCRQFDPPAAKHPIELLPDSAGKGLAKKLREAKGYVSILEPHTRSFMYVIC
jgi:hypothetical protein